MLTPMKASMTEHVDAFRDRVCPQCPGCGRRSSSMLGDVCRDCYFNAHDPSEKTRFETICRRHQHKMTNRTIYLRRRKMTLRATAIAWEKFHTVDRAVIDQELRMSLYHRYRRACDHLYLLDEIWNYWHPYPRDWVSGSWGKSFAVMAAVDALKAGNFDAFCEELHAKRSEK